ncbi:hypothetical protein SZ25_00554 [Candidatus Arcanobacter lacustris]|uniref:Uncharacterized protein n=1 Tax=Candidatus Arcanibacter lacustris TaxID=1607817 RepID=A0A0F5MPB6_9RICK|nr:hypothetical protein SZ25_00554 [Candidatus Arcanobacter lacustris]
MVLSKIASVIQSDLIHDTIKSERYFIVYGFFLNANFLFFDLLKVPPSGMSLKSNIFLKSIISLLGCGLILKDFWLIKLKNFKIIYWHLTLLISLSFYFPLMLFNNQSSSLFKLYNLLAIIILISFIRIILFAIIYILGITVAYLFYRYVTLNPKIDNEIIMLLVTSFILAMIYQILAYQWQIINLIKKNNSKIKIHNHDLAKKILN